MKKCSSSGAATTKHQNAPTEELYTLINHTGSHQFERQRSSGSSDIAMSKRPGYSELARKRIRVVTNFYRLGCDRKVVYHYDVTVDPVGSPLTRALPTSLRHAVIASWCLQYQYSEFSPVHDGHKNLFTCKELPIDQRGKEFSVSLESDRGRSREFTLAVKPVQKKSQLKNVVDLSAIEAYVGGETAQIPNEARTVLETILAHRPRNSPQLAMGNSFFMSTDRICRSDLGFGVEMWSGYSQNIRFTARGPAVVINTAAAVFHKEGRITDTVGEILRRDVCEGYQYLQHRDIERLSRKLSGLRVRVTHQKNKRNYCIERVSDKTAAQLTFSQGGSPVTVQQYFERQYNYKLKYPSLPCLKMASGSSEVYMPMEVCEVTPKQRIRGKLDDGLTASMIRQTALPPSQKFQVIEHNVGTMSEMCAQKMLEYDLGVDLQPVETDARVLPQPAIRYGTHEVSVRDNGVWDIRYNRFVSARTVEKPFFVCLAECEDSALNNYFYALCKAGRDVGLAIKTPVFKARRHDNLETKEVFDRARSQGADLILFVLDKRDKYHPYDEIKYLADIEYRIATQCVTRRVVECKMDERTAANICLKINAKLGGTNHEISGWTALIKKERIVVMGADVIHHVRVGYPSIAALVGGVDESVAKYAHCCRALRNPKERWSQEIILDLAAMIKKVLKRYYKANRDKPKRILFFRDGVSESQFQQVFDKEIPMIREACRTLSSSYSPPVTFVVVQKRHPVRIRPKREQDGVGRCGNVPAGTVVDRDIVDPQLYDFYLCSHEGIQGTSKPTRYTVLLDENGFEPRDLELLTYNLCHLVARCNRSISIPAPVKYADLLCTRASEYTNYIFRNLHLHDPQQDFPRKIDEVMEAMDKMDLRMFFV